MVQDSPDSIRRSTESAEALEPPNCQVDGALMYHIAAFSCHMDPRHNFFDLTVRHTRKACRTGVCWLVVRLATHSCLCTGLAHEIAQDAYQRTILPNSYRKTLESNESLSP
jgi:hypothetical protein